MADIVRIGTANATTTVIMPPAGRVATLAPWPTNCNPGGLVLGEACKSSDALYIKSDGKLWRAKVNIVATPAAPTIADNAGAGASALKAGTNWVSVTYVTAYGETLPSIPVEVQTTATHWIRISAISSIPTGVTAVNVYVNGQYWGTMAVTTNATAQTDFDGIAAGGNTGAGAPLVNSAFTDLAYKVRGFASQQGFAAGEAITPLRDLIINYATGMTPGADLWLSAATAGALCDTPPTNYLKPVAYVWDATRIKLYGENVSN